jgi:hypothetical protein
VHGRERSKNQNYTKISLTNCARDIFMPWRNSGPQLFVILVAELKLVGAPFVLARFLHFFFALEARAVFVVFVKRLGCYTFLCFVAIVRFGTVKSHFL